MLTQREQRLLRGLQRRKIRMAEGCFLAEGIRTVEDLLAADIPVRLLLHTSTLEDTERGAAVTAQATRRGIDRRVLPDAELALHAQTQTPQGVLAIAEIPVSALGALRMDHAPAAVLVLDAVQDPGNFGTLVRTAEALGAAGVVTLPGTVDPWNAKSVRAAVGSSFRLPIIASSWAELAPWFAREEVQIYAAMAGAPPFGAAAPPVRAALVMGNEGAGLSAETLQNATRPVGIPLRGRAESLNVSAAAAVLLFQLLNPSV